MAAGVHPPERFREFFESESAVNHRMEPVERDGRIHGCKDLTGTDKNALNPNRIHQHRHNIQVGSLRQCSD
jgi:hypothetical protein